MLIWTNIIQNALTHTHTSCGLHEEQETALNQDLQISIARCQIECNLT